MAAELTRWSSLFQFERPVVGFMFGLILLFVFFHMYSGLVDYSYILVHSLASVLPFFSEKSKFLYFLRLSSKLNVLLHLSYCTVKSVLFIPAWNSYACFPLALHSLPLHTSQYTLAYWHSYTHRELESIETNPETILKSLVDISDTACLITPLPGE